MITSRTNSFIKTLKSLADKKNRDELNLFSVEGVKEVSDAISFGAEIFAVVGTADGLEKISVLSGVKTEEVSESVFSAISGVCAPQGVFAAVVKPENKLTAPINNCVLLDGVADPGNVGAIIRTAAAAGYNDVYITSDGADAFSPKAVRASMGGIFRVKIHSAQREEILKVIDKPVVVADMFGEDVFSPEFKKSHGGICLVIGNEGNGVSETVRQSAQKTVKIPMENGVESLNAAVSAGILMYALKGNNNER